MIQPVRITLTEQEMADAAQIGRQQRQDALRQHLRPVWRATEEQHIRGRYGEIAAARYLGEQLDPDWTLQGDHRRGCDVGGWNVRGSYPGQWFMWRRWDYDGPYLFPMTRHAPDIWLIGWLPSEECRKVAVTRPGRQYQWIPAKALHQLPDWGQERYLPLAA